VSLSDASAAITKDRRLVTLRRVIAEYDEFALLPDNASEAGLPWNGPPQVRRVNQPVADDQRVSALLWGDGDPELVLIHGGAQNAHTWDTVALALDRPLLAVDLPGHGHSDWREDRDYWPVRNAEAIAKVIDALAPSAQALVGMSLGGLTAIRIAATRPDLVQRLVVVDVTPGVDQVKAAPIADFVSGPESFESFDVLLARTQQFNPTRSESSLRRGLMHNARQRDDGQWVWRYDRLRPPGSSPGFADLWHDVGAVQAPTLLVRGSLSGVVDDSDVERFRSSLPDARVEMVEGAGHSIQGDRPVELAGLIKEFLDIAQ
jgi:pimeloyl-ACP methyl ester carboxylesterase